MSRPAARRLLAATFVTEKPVDITPNPPKATSRRSPSLMIAAALLATFFVGAGAFYFYMRPETLRIAVGPSSSLDARVIQLFAQNLARERGGVRLKIVATDSEQASATAMDKGQADLAVIRGDLPLPKDVQSVAILRKNLVVIWVPPPRAQPDVKPGAKPVAKPAAKPAKADAPKAKAAKAKSSDDEDEDKADTKKKTAAPGAITKLEELKGKRIGIIGRNNVNVLLLALEKYNIAESDITIVPIGVSNVAENVRNHSVDVFVTAGPVNSRITADAISASAREGNPTFIAIEAADAIAERNPAYEATEITAGAYGASPSRPDDSVKTISFAHYIVARKTLSEATVTTLTRSLFAARQSVASDVPQAPPIETPDTDKDAFIVAHPGAAAYTDGEEKTFFDRYSDLLYWGLMALSAVGSAGAWFASYLRRDERESSEHLRDHLMEILRASREATSGEALNELQKRADEVLHAAIVATENGSLDESGLSVFSLVLQQTQAAIADRRASLTAQIQPA